MLNVTRNVPASSTTRSLAAFERAQRSIPGGVNSPVRAFKSVGGTPRFMQRAHGSKLFDIDGNEYLDFVMSWGPMLLGHAHPDIVAAITAAAANGTSFGTPTQAESELAELVMKLVPSIERLRFVSSGTEATMSALRVARDFTGRELVLKFAGCYHGHGDAFLISAGSGALTNGVPDSPGVTAGVARDTLVVPFNDLDAVRTAFTQYTGKIAAVIVEPYVGNMGFVRALPGFLQGLRDVTAHDGAILIFDEVMTGFRVAAGGVQALEGVRPDLTTLGKIIGGGLPVGAFGGRADIMNMLSPVGPVYQAGTLSGNPLAMAAGIATLSKLDAALYDRLAQLGSQFTTGMSAMFTRHGVAHAIDHAGSMVGFFFSKEPVVDLTSAKTSDTAFYAKFFHAMLDRGIYLAPSQFEAGFISAAHTPAEIEHTITVANESLSAILAGVVS